MPGNRRPDRGFMNPSWLQIRKTKETEWIKILRIAFPYVLNDTIGEE